MLDGALAKWKEIPVAARRLPPELDVAPEHRWEHGYPAGGLALERFSRDVDPAGLAAEPDARWNRDTVWCSADELRAWLPRDPAVGDAFALKDLAERLARFALVDDVRGQTLPYAPEEIERAELTARVVAREGSRVELELTGATRAEAGEEWLLGDNLWTPRRNLPRALACRLLGRATADVERGAFADFELAAVGVRTGRTQMNGRGADLGPSVVGFWLSPAPDRLAPAFAALYVAIDGVDWIPRPAVATWRESPAECGLEGR